MQKDLLNGNAVPRPTGATRLDMERLYQYLFKAMEELRFALAEIEKRLPEESKTKKAAK